MAIVVATSLDGHPGNPDHRQQVDAIINKPIFKKNTWIPT
jgi:hypothetical protein